MRLKCLLEFVSQEALALGIDRIQNLDEFHKNLQKRALRVVGGSTKREIYRPVTYEYK